MSNLVTIYGGSGFVGRYITQRLAHKGWRVRVAVRRPNEAGFVRPYSTPGMVEPVFCNIRNDASVKAAMAGASAVVNCVGTFDKAGPNNFEAVQVEGAKRIARLAAEASVSHLVHLSAIGADPGGRSLYAQSKGRGEQAVSEAFPDVVILRPSVIFGPEDAFFNRFANMTRFGPVLALIGGHTRFQPVFVDDVAAAAVKGVLGEAGPGVYELGGPDVETLAGLMHRMLKIVERRRLVINLPFWVGATMGTVLDAASALTLRLIPNGIVTADQVKQLRSDNVVSDGAKGFDDLGIAPTEMEAVLPSYLWRYRPSGQYAAIKDSAKRLKKS